LPQAGFYEATPPVARLSAPDTGEFKRKAALGENGVDPFSDRGSTPLASTIYALAMRVHFSLMRLEKPHGY